MSEPRPKTLAYLASPYTNYPDGIEIAFRDISRIAATLLSAGVETYSPIAHCHPLAMYGDLNALDRDFWLSYQENMMLRCDVLIVAEMKKWNESHGIAHEIKYFEAAGKKIYHLNIDTMAMRDRRLTDDSRSERSGPVIQPHPGDA